MLNRIGDSLATLVIRTVYAEVPPRVQYELTPLGETLCAPIKAIHQWAETHIESVSQAQADYDSRENVANAASRWFLHGFTIHFLNPV